MPLIRPYPVVLALFIASCGHPAAVIQSQTEIPPTTAFDGSYQSAIRVIHEAAMVEGYSWCQTPGQPIITVTNGQFTYVVPHPDLPGDHPPTAFPAHFGRTARSSVRACKALFRGECAGPRLKEASTEWAVFTPLPATEGEASRCCGSLRQRTARTLCGKPPAGSFRVAREELGGFERPLRRAAGRSKEASPPR